MTLPRSTEGAWLFLAIAKDIAPRDIAKVRRRDCHVRLPNAIFRLDRFECRDRSEFDEARSQRPLRRLPGAPGRTGFPIRCPVPVAPLGYCRGLPEPLSQAVPVVSVR